MTATPNGKRTAAAVAVKCSASTPILPLTYAPAFDGTGYASSSSMPLGFVSSQPTAFAAAASGAVGQLTAYLKRQCDRGGEQEGEGGVGGGLGQRSARLLSATGSGCLLYTSPSPRD